MKRREIDQEIAIIYVLMYVYMCVFLKFLMSLLSLIRS